MHKLYVFVPVVKAFAGFVRGLLNLIWILDIPQIWVKQKLHSNVKSNIQILYEIHFYNKEARTPAHHPLPSHDNCNK